MRETAYDRAASAKAELSGQNTSSAVMAQRVEPHDSLDWFPTPPWATRALLETWRSDVTDMPFTDMSVWEPACGVGDMAEPLKEYFGEVYASDVHDYGYGEVQDFLWPSTRTADWIVTNPPFRLAAQFAQHALDHAECVGLLVRTAFLESAERYETLFKATPPSLILQFAERVPMHRASLTRGASTATAYCWLVWMGRDGWTPSAKTGFEWIPPCRKRLERPGDYWDDPEHPFNQSGAHRAVRPSAGSDPSPSDPPRAPSNVET